MADTKISALTAATTPLAGTEVLPIVQSGVTKQVSIANLTAGRAVAMLSNTVGTSPGAVTPIVQADDLVVQNSGAAGITIFSPDANAGRVVFGTVSNNQNVILYGQYNYGFDVYLEGNKVIHFDTPTKDTTWSLGNLIQGTAAKGINFTANTPASGMTSQLLNWYEEGTWSPTLATDGTNFSAVTYNSVRGGRYVRMGKLVHIQGWFYTDSITVGSASGNIQIGGLPFTAAANSGSSQLGRSAINISYCVAWASSFPIGGVIESNSTNIWLVYRTAVDGATSNVPYTAAGTGSAANRIGFSGTYVCA